ncbi:neurexin-3 isoform X4 [Anopheles stephensi]|uniref:neurexin-3 isoform X4 n=1 Tax=Anopheles stephensi TaxID=30069 RepID=UPI001658A871|nr:neurexin-3 isoform X4 [Anopheles stephensi]
MASSVRAEEHSIGVSGMARERDRGGGPQTSDQGECVSIMESATLHSSGERNVIRLSASRKCKRKRREPAAAAGVCVMAANGGSAEGSDPAPEVVLPHRPYLCGSHSNSIKSPNHADNNVCTEAAKGANVRQRNSSLKPRSSGESNVDNNSNYHCQQQLASTTPMATRTTTATATSLASQSKAHQSFGLASASTLSPQTSSLSSASPSLPFSLPKILSNAMVTIRLPKLLLLGLLLSQLGAGCSGFVLDGSQNSFAQFRKWYTGLNGSLELEFKTEQPNGLVLYTDDGGTFDFFELKLVEGALRLRYNLGGGAQIITVGRDLHDGHWHKVQVMRNDEHTTLTVDGVSQSRSSRGKEFLFGKFATNSDVFVGGMPNWYNTKLALLALPSVIFEPRFRGSVRNLVYSDQPGVSPRRQEMRQPRDIKCGDSPCDLTAMPREKVTRVGRGGNGLDPPRTLHYTKSMQLHHHHHHHHHHNHHHHTTTAMHHRSRHTRKRPPEPPFASSADPSTHAVGLAQYIRHRRSYGRQQTVRVWKRNAQFGGIYPPNYDLVHHCLRTLPSDKQLRTNVTDACERHDPCQHGGICISTDSGPICECRNVEYEGTYCERDKAPSEATFRGTEFLSYDLGQTGGEPIVSAQDAITLYFRTRQPNGLLFYTGHGTDYLNLALRDGGVSLTMGLSNGKQEMHIKPSRVRFDDHQWHKVTVHRRIQEISSITSFCRLVAVVDDVYTDHSHIAGKFTMLSSSRVYVGGAVNPRALLGARVHNNFVGCLRKVEFSADTLRLNLIDLARTGSKLIQVAGRVDYTCPSGDPQDPVTFTTRESYLLLPPWDASKQGILSFKFRTNEPNGLIILNTMTRAPKSNFFAVELLNGHIYIHMDLGSGAVKVRASRRRVDDGVWHELSLRRNGRDGKVGVDGQWNEFRTPGEASQMQLDSPMYIGGIGPPYAEIYIPPAIWTATLRQGFVGCLRDLTLSGKPVDIAHIARQQDSGAIKPSCHVIANQCGGQVSPCQNGGQCTEGWNRPLCDCSATLFTGPTCGRESATLAFNGSQHMAVWIGGTQGSRTQTEELVIRFKTSRPAGLLLLTSAESSSSDRLEIGLVAGRVRANVRLGDREKNLLAGLTVLNDNNWHTVRFSRRASNLRLQVDGTQPVRGMLSEAILGRHSTLEVKSIHLGGLFHAEEEIQMTAAMPNFVGQLQGFVYNGHRYIDLVKSLGPELSSLPTTTFKLTARFVNSPPGSPYLPATFRSKHSYVGLPILKAYSSVFIDFRFKTLEPNGLLFYNGGKRTDFVAVELVNGHIHYVFDLGDGPITLRDKARIHMNDNRWHSVSIRRPGPKTHTLAVDESIEIYTASGNNMHLELEGILYVGGVFKDMYTRLPSSIASRSGFEGCIASVDLADTSPSLTEDAVVPSSLVVSGCEGPTKCSQNACANRGVCVQQWNAYACECDMTSFTGPTCYDESISYEFGNNKGLIQYNFPPGRQPDTEEDSIALGFVTTKSDAVLLRIESSTTQDYIEMEIVEGNVFTVYNVGTQDLPLGEVAVKVNDNNYHIVRFTRTGANATLQIDDYNVQTVSSIGHQSTVFTSMANIQVGGKIARNGRSRIERPFSGVIAGLSVNRLRVLDLAAERDPHINVRGDVQLTPASGYPGVMDDLIFSGAGSGCRGDDEDECTPPFENGSGDDLITPVYVPPTKQTATTSSGGKDGSGGRGRGKPGEKLCDDEDCLHGSGSGEVTEVFTTSTARSSETSPEMTYTTVDFDRKTDGTPTYTTQRRTPDTYSSSSHTTSEMDTTSGMSSGTTGSYGSSSSSGSYGSPVDSYGTTVSMGTTGSGTTTGTTASGRVITTSTGTTVGLSTYGSTTQQQQHTPSETTVSYRDRDRDHIRETTYPQTPTTTEEEIVDVHVPTDDEDDGEEHRTTVHQTPNGRRPPPVKVAEPPNPEPEQPYQPHPQPYPPTRLPKHKGGRINSEAEERTAMIIGIVAGALIAVILVILLVLWIKSNGDRSYKTEHDKSGLYGQGPSAALLGGSHGNSGTHNAHHYNQQSQQGQHHQPQHHHQPSAPPHYNGGHHSNGGSTLPLNGSLRHHGPGNGAMGAGGSGGGGMGMGSGGNMSMGYGGLNGSGSDKGSMQSSGGGGVGPGGGGGGGGGGMGQPQRNKSRNSKDIKEWYV